MAKLAGWPGQGPGALFFHSELLKRSNIQVYSFKKFTGGWGGGGGGGLFDYSVYSWPWFCQGQG